MIATVITFLTEKVVAVVITRVVVVAAGPTLILTINGSTITITPTVVASTSRHHDEDERTRIVVEVKTAGDAVIAKLNNLEASCDAQMEQRGGKPRWSATT